MLAQFQSTVAKKSSYRRDLHYPSHIIIVYLATQQKILFGGKIFLFRVQVLWHVTELMGRGKLYHTVVDSPRIHR